MKNNIFVERGVPTNTFHIEGKCGTGKTISPEGIVDKLENIAVTAFVKIPEGRLK